MSVEHETLQNHSYPFLRSTTPTAIPQAIIDNIYTYIQDYLCNYMLRKPSYDEANHSPFVHPNVRKKIPLLRHAFVCLDSVTHQTAYFDGLNPKLVSTSRVPNSLLRTANYLHSVYDYVATIFKELPRSHAPVQAVHRTLDHSTTLLASMKPKRSCVGLTLEYEDISPSKKRVT